jgi:hypothetical protein
MKNIPTIRRILTIVLVFGLVFVGCPTEDSSDNTISSSDSVDPAFWFEEIYIQLIGRVGEQSSEGYSRVIGEGMGQAANTQYVCNAINAKWGTSFQPAAGTANQAANCEYLLKMIDRANNNTTNHGSSARATKQLVDTVAIMNAVNTLWVPGDKFVVVDSGSNKTAYSTDGINWTVATLPSTECST